MTTGMTVGDEPKRPGPASAQSGRSGRVLGAPVLRGRDLTKVYRMGEVDVHALRGVDIDLPPGDLTVLLGASGSGKSTLLNILGGLDVPTAGQVFYRDWELTQADEAELSTLRTRVSAAWEDRSLLEDDDHRSAVRRTVANAARWPSWCWAHRSRPWRARAHPAALGRCWS